MSGGITVIGIGINNIRFADDTVIMAGNMDFQRMIDKIDHYSEEIGLHRNINKTKVLLLFTKSVVNVIMAKAGQICGHAYK